MDQENSTALERQEDLRLISSPSELVRQWHEATKALQEIIASRPVLEFNGKPYLDFAYLQMVGSLCGISCKVEWTRPLELFGARGFEASALAIARDGTVISRAEAMVLDSEKNWRTKSWAQMRAMSQTRACRRAFLNVLSFVTVLGGYGIEELAEDFESEEPDQELQALFKRAKALLGKLGKADEETELALERFAQLDVETAREKVAELERRAREREQK